MLVDTVLHDAEITAMNKGCLQCHMQRSDRCPHHQPECDNGIAAKRPLLQA
jgi:hypothetical protein